MQIQVYKCIFKHLFCKFAESVYICLQWIPLPPVSTTAENAYKYYVDIYTGLRWGSGTKSKVYINLIGSKQSSGAILLEDGVRKVHCVFVCNSGVF